jgi:DMSO/TMAO reductase YedYZ molybdopterin-dependent catalytic subunit
MLVSRTRTLYTVCGVAVAVSVAVVAVAAQPGSLRIGGAVAKPLTLTQAELAALPHQSVRASAHNQGGEYSGVPLMDLLKRAGAASGESLRGRELAKYVIVTGADGYRAVFALAELDSGFTDRVVLVADSVDGKPLPSNAAPFQVIVPGEKRPARWVRQVVSIDVLEAAGR